MKANDIKIAIIGDMHFGIKKGHPLFLEFMLSYMERKFMDIHSQGISTIIQMGDMFDDRKLIDVNVAVQVRDRLQAILDKTKQKLIILVGNHNIYYRDKNHVHNLFFLDSIKGVEIIDADIKTIDILDKTLVFVPWINKENKEQFVEQLKETKASYCFGHFELVDFPMYKRQIATHGDDDTSFLSGFDLVLSGHYHTISRKRNILYVGSPYHLTWADYPDGTERGWFSLDIVTGEYILNKNDEYKDTMFGVYHYDSQQKEIIDHASIIREIFHDKILKIIVRQEDLDTKKYKQFLLSLSDISFIECLVCPIPPEQKNDDGDLNTIIDDAPSEDMDDIKTNVSQISVIDTVKNHCIDIDQSIDRNILQELILNNYQGVINEHRL